MKYYKLGIAALALAGCSEQVDLPTISEKVEGEPLSVQMTTARYGRALSAVVLQDDGRLASCGLGNTTAPSREYTELAAFIEAEINDGDHEKITMYGSLEQDRCRIRSVDIGGKTITFP